MSLFVNAEGGLTTAGYALFIILALIALVAAGAIASKVSGKKLYSAWSKVKRKKIK